MTEQDHLATSDLVAIPARPTTVAGGTSDRADESGSSAPRSGSSELLDGADRESFQDRWQAIQTGFVDEPRRSVEQADALVAEAMNRLAEIFAQERESLESQWGEGTSVSTEELRVALQRYRSFFHRLLTV